MSIRSFENMVRYYHSDGSCGVAGDNPQEVNILWDLISRANKGKIGGIPIETYKKVAPDPRILCETNVQAIELASAMNQGVSGDLIGMIVGIITMSR